MLLIWDSSHWASYPAPCRHCGGPTHLRTTAKTPAHKVCEEAAVDGEGNQPPAEDPPKPRRRKTR